MSKYFNETRRARNTAFSTDEPETKGTRDSREVVRVVQAAIADAPLEHVEGVRKLSLPVSGIVRSLFQGSDMLTSAEEAYRALRTRLLRIGASSRLASIAVTSAAQGEGKTITSLNLASCCAQLHDLKVVLIDADLRTQGLTRLLGSPSGPGLSEVLSGQCEIRDALVSTDSPNLFFIGSGNSLTSPVELLASPKWQELLETCSNSFRLVLVDSPPVLNLSDAELISAACDGILMVVRAQKTKREVLEIAAARLDSKKVLGSVFNAAAHSHHTYTYGYLSAKDR